MLTVVTVVALVLALPLGYCLYTRKLKKSSYLELPQKAQTEAQKGFTLEELSQYDGVKHQQVYISLKNVVFDVSISPKYKPGASYAAFAGRDISVALAKMSFDDTYINTYQKVKLTKDEMGTLEGWFTYMKERYPVVGEIKVSKRED